MSQTFKKSSVATGVALAIAAFAGVASANQFDASSQSVLLGTANMSQGANASVPNQEITIIETANADWSTASGTLIASLSGGAKFKQASITPSAGLTVAPATLTVGGLAAAGTATITFYIGGSTYVLTLTIVSTDGWNAATDTITVTKDGVAVAAAATDATVKANLGDALAFAINAAVTGSGTVDTTANVAYASTAGTTGIGATSVVVTFKSGAAGTVTAMNAISAATVGTTTGTITPVNSGAIIDTTTGKLTVTATSNSGSTESLKLSRMVVDSTAVALGGDINLTMEAGTMTGVSTGVVSKLATVQSNGVAVKTAATTAPTVAKGGVVTIDNALTLTENTPASLADESVGNKEIKLTLPAGFVWIAAPTESADTLGTGGAGGVAAADALPADGSYATFNVSGSTSAAGAWTANNGQILVPTSAPSGDVKVTVGVKVAGATTYTNTDVVLFTVADKGTTNTAVLDTTGVAPTAYTKIFAGRKAQDTKVDVKISEIVGNTLIGGGNVAFTLPAGVTTGAVYDSTSTYAVSNTSGLTLGTVTDVAGTAAATGQSSVLLPFTTAADGTATAGSLRYYFKSLDLTSSVATGDLSVAVSGTGGATANSVKVAEVIRATSASASGSVQTVAPLQTIALPDLVIQENAVAATLTGKAIGVEVTGLTIQTGAAADAVVGANLVNGTDVTVKVFNAAGTDVTATALGTTPTLTVGNGGTGVADQVAIQLAAQSTATTGAYKFVISGLKAKVASGAAAGDINAVIAGSHGTGNASSTAAQLVGAESSAWTSEGGAYKQTLKVGAVVSSTKPAYPTATVADQTKFSLAGLPLTAAGNDQGTQGAVYVALIFQGNVFFLGSNGAWTPFTTSASVPAYFTGALGTTTLDIVPTASAFDVTAAKGALFVAGYGIGIAGLSNPFDEFIKSARYNVIYTVK